MNVVNNDQIAALIAAVAPTDWANIVIAYEPVWAIGTGLTATPDQAQEAHQFIREYIAKLSGGDISCKTRILYGGSVTADNAKELLFQPDIDGALVGGASLDPRGFAKIVTAATSEEE